MVRVTCHPDALVVESLQKTALRAPCELALRCALAAAAAVFGPFTLLSITADRKRKRTHPPVPSASSSRLVQVQVAPRWLSRSFATAHVGRLGDLLRRPTRSLGSVAVWIYRGARRLGRQTVVALELVDERTRCHGRQTARSRCRKNSWARSWCTCEMRWRRRRRTRAQRILSRAPCWHGRRGCRHTPPP